MTPAGTSNELDVQNEWEENTTHTLYVLDNAVTHNTSRRTAAGRLIALPVHLLTNVAWYSTWSLIVSDLHNHTNAALRPQRVMQTELSAQADRWPLTMRIE